MKEDSTTKFIGLYVHSKTIPVAIAEIVLQGAANHLLDETYNS